jgi:hypothetical protein
MGSGGAASPCRKWPENQDPKCQCPEGGRPGGPGPTRGVDPTTDEHPLPRSRAGCKQAGDYRGLERDGSGMCVRKAYPTLFPWQRADAAVGVHLCPWPAWSSPFAARHEGGKQIRCAPEEGLWRRHEGSVVGVLTGHALAMHVPCSTITEYPLHDIWEADGSAHKCVATPTKPPSANRANR